MASAFATVHGYLSDAPSVNTTKNGTKVARIRLGWSKKMGEETKWSNINVVLWGKLAETAEQYLEKGSLVTVNGELETNSWEKDGEKRSNLELHASQLKLEGKPKGNGEKQERPTPSSKPAGKPASKPAVKSEDDFPSDDGFGDIPF
jgi:single-strand DNA-binding protein